MVRRAILFVILMFSVTPLSLALREICDSGGGDCANHQPHPGPDFGADPQAIDPPQGGGGGGGPVFILSSQEPLRNPDKGPLGVVLSTGEFQITATDLEIPGRGFPFRLQRTYRSKGDGEMSLLGYNWTLSLDEYLTPGTWLDTVNGQTVQCPAVLWQMGNGFSDVWINTCNPFHVQEWKAFLGFFGKIRFLSTTLGYQIRYPDGTVKSYGQLGHNAQDQPIWILTKVEDRNGNMMTIHHNSTKRGIDWIADTLGRKIIFEYDLSHRLTTVTDFNTPSRSVVYTYDEVRGDLITVRSPIVSPSPGGIDDAFSSGKTTRYVYLGADGCDEAALKHNIKSVIDGNNNTFLTNTYRATADTRCGTVATPDPNPIDVMDSQNYGGGAVDPKLTYEYVFVAWATAPGTLASKTIVTDRNGNRQIHGFNGQGNPLWIEYQTTNQEMRPGEGNYTENYTYVDYGNGNQPMLVAEHTQSGGTNVNSSGDLAPYLTGGMTEAMLYDQSGGPFKGGNLLSVHRTPGERGAAAGQGDLWTRYTYDPIFNQQLTIEDPSGHVTNFTYDWQEGDYNQLTDDTPPDNKLPAHLNSAWWPANYLQTVMDPVYGYSQKGELNGDGYHRGGNLIKVSEGVATDYAGLPTGEIITYTAYNSFGLPTRTWDAEDNETQFRYFPEDNPDGKLPVTPLPPPEDGRHLSPAPDEAGGGYLREKVLDATLTTPLPVGVSSSLREGGQNPDEQDVHLSFEYDPVGNITKSTDGRGVSTEYTVNELNQIVQIKHAASASTDTPSAAPLSYMEQFQFDGNNNLIKHRTEQRDDVPQAPGQNKWITESTCYDSSNRKWGETVSTADSPSVNMTTLYYYDRVGNLTKTISPAGNVVNRTYDKRDLPFQEIAVNGCIEAPPAPVDCSHEAPTPQCTSTVGSTDAVTTYDYDGSGNIIRVTDPEGHVSLTGYDGYNRKVVGFDPAYQKSSLTYDARGNVTEQITRGTIKGATPAPPSPPVTEYPEIAHQKFYYDELSRVRRLDTRFFKYDDAGNLISITTDQNAGLTTTAPGEPAPAGDGYGTKLFKYDRLGRTTKLVDDNGHFSEIRYDGLGRKLKTFLNAVAPFTPGGTDERNSVENVYDKNGNIRCTLEKQYGADHERPGDPQNQKLLVQRFRTDFKYDSMNRLTDSRVVGKVGESDFACPEDTFNFDSPPSVGMDLVTRLKYDSRGNKIRIKDPSGKLVRSSYDGLNRLKSRAANFLANNSADWEGTATIVPSSGNPDGVVTTTLAYDTRGRLSSLTDDNNRVTSFTYDNLNRKTKITYPDTTYRQVTYNRDSLATTWTHSSNSVYSLTATIEYDWLHRSKQVTVNNYNAPLVQGTVRQAYQYDGLGRLTLAQDDLNIANPNDYIDSEVEFTYNSMSKVLSEKQSWADNSTGTYLTGSKTVTSEYNSVGFRTAVIYPDNERTVTFTPDELNRIKQITDHSLDPYLEPYFGPQAGFFVYDYLGPNRILKRTSPNGTKLTMLSGPGDPDAAGYDNAGRLKDYSNTTADGTAGFSEFAYDYDNSGNRKFERRVHDPSGSNWKGDAYEYDASNRLIKRKEGDLTTTGSMPSTTLTQDFLIDGLGNWKAHKRNSTTYTQTINSLNQYTVFNGPSGQKSLMHDFLGNLTNENSSVGEQTYYYDFLNRLVAHLSVSADYTVYRYDALGRRISKNLNGLTHTRYFYDGARLIQERDGTTASQLKASYVYGNGPDEVLTRRATIGGATSNIYYHTNALGSVTAVTLDNGFPQERYRYDAYGQVTFLTGSGTVQGCNCSPLQNNILYTGRYFDIESRLYYYRARTYYPYLGRFLQRDPLGEAASLNLYNYVSNNPVRFTDPSGMHEWTQDELSEQFASDFQDSRARMHGGSIGHSDAWRGEQMGMMTREQGFNVAEMNTILARKMLGLPMGDPRSPMNSDGTQTGGGSSRAGVRITESASGTTSVSESSDETDRGFLDWLNGFAGSINGWLSRHCLECPVRPSRFSPPMKLGIMMPPFGRLGAGGILSGSSNAAASSETAIVRALDISIHAAEQMEERGVTEAMVKAALENGTQFIDPKNGTINYVLEGGFASGKDLLVGTNVSTGTVTTVIRGWDLVVPRFIPIETGGTPILLGP